MREMSDSTALATDPGRLRARLAGEGYVFLRGLLPAEAVAAAQRGVLAELARGGWADGSGRPAGQRQAVTVRDALADPAFRAALSSPALNRLPYLPLFRPLIRGLLGPRAFSYPVKVLRTVYPERPPAITLGRYVHQDYQNSGVQDMLTTWLPLMKIPRDVGGLAVLPGSNLGPPVRPRLLRRHEPGWVTADYRPGDVLIFHCMTVHAALPNRAGTMRLSTDCRWQRPDQAAPAEMVLGPARARAARSQVNGPIELFSRMFGGEKWWEPVPAGLTLRPRQELAAAGAPPEPSRFFPVHPGWQRWQPPGGPLR
jgi:Phytanoyl-CoA dioxygenase (PhyH)